MLTLSFAVQALSLDRKLKQLYLVSVAQFRPEKNHSMQLRAFALARQLAMASAPSKAGELAWPMLVLGLLCVAQIIPS